MIAFVKNLVPRVRPRITLGRPAAMTLITGADREKIDAIYDRNDRLQHLVVITKSKRLS